MNEVEILTNEKTVVIGGESIVVKPYSWVNSLKMAKYLSVILKTLVDNIDEFSSFSEADTENGIVFAEKILALAEKAGKDDVVEALTVLVAVGIKKDEEFVANLPLDEACEAALAVYEVNKDFFTKMMKTKKEEK